MVEDSCLLFFRKGKMYSVKNIIKTLNKNNFNFKKKIWTKFYN